MLQLLLSLLFLVQRAHAGCNTTYGPAGTIKCVAFARYYNQYQWATCLSDAYIQQKSNHKHICINRLATYCYYQCMLEVHDKESGIVSKDCSCTSSPTQHPVINPTTSLPPECYSPSGASCQWYRDCLEKKYPCEATSNAYAITYAEKFCNLYSEHKNFFTSKGQQWIDGVRKCLQVALVPLLRPWRNPTCKEIRKVAFDSHTSCYLNPDKGVPSVCDLDCFEYLKIFWVIKGSFIKLDTAWESLKGMWNVLKKCSVQCIENNKVIKMTKIGIQKLKRRAKRSSDPLPEADAQSRFADQVGLGIANTLKWNSVVMDWLAYPLATNYSYDPSRVTIYVVLADKKGLGIVQTSAPSVNFNNTVQELASAIQQGKIPLTIGDSNVWLKSLDSCSDKFCNKTKSLAVSSKMPTFNKAAVTSKMPTLNKAAVTSKMPTFNKAAVMDRGLKSLLAITVLAIMLIYNQS